MLNDHPPFFYTDIPSFFFPMRIFCFSLMFAATALISTLFSGCDTFTGSPDWPPAPPPAPAVYQIRPSDKLFVTMYMEPESSKEATIARDGTANLYLIGQVKLAGLSRDQATEKVIQLYKKYYKNPRVNIEIREYAPRRVIVDGYVMRAGPVFFMMEERLTLAQAIAAAGGIQPRGSQVVTLTRTLPDKTTKNWEIDMQYIYTGKKADITLQEDDRIYVKDSVI